MELPVNQFKRGMKAGKPQIGLWSSLSSHYSVEVIAGSGFDWLLLDTEHSPNDLENVVTQLQAAAAYPTTSIVRPGVERHGADQTLSRRRRADAADPLCADAAGSRRRVAYTRYPLRGVRGVAGTTRATRFGRVKDYFKRAEEEICVLVQVETQLGLDNLDAIANTDGVDGVFIGPADLSAGLGHLGNIPHPEVQKAIDDAVKRIRKAGKAPGILAPVEADARRYLDQGCLFVAVGADVGLLARESEKLCAKFKS